MLIYYVMDFNLIVFHSKRSVSGYCVRILPAIYYYSITMGERERNGTKNGTMVFLSLTINWVLKVTRYF